MSARGFSFIEVMVASILFLLTLAGVLTAFHMAAGMFAHYEKETAAMHIAESTLEDLLLRARSDPDLTDGATITRTFREDGTPDAAGPFAAVWSVAGSTPMNGLRTIDLAVRWSEGGVTRQVRLVTVRE